MAYISGILIAFVAIVFSIFHLQQDFINYFDPVGLCIVIGGTIAVATIIFPWNHLSEIKDAFRSLFGEKIIDMKTLNMDCFELVKMAQAGQVNYNTVNDKFIAHQILHDGSELIQLGFKPQKINDILEERIFQWAERKNRVANAIRSLAKYPPAFGLVGTVLGLVSLMRAISNGSSSSEAGVRMAVALVSTLYGLMTANLIINPAGENILKKASDEKKSAELALRAVLMAAQRTNLLEAQEILNSFVNPKDRLNQYVLLY